MKSNGRKERYRFVRHGRAPHLVVESFADLRCVPNLDPALWVASSAPVSCIDIDKNTLAYIDADGNGRITHAELSAAVTWLCDVERNEDRINNRSTEVVESDINPDHPDGLRILAAIRKIVARADMGSNVALPQVQRIIGELQDRPASGSGVVLASAAEDDAAKACIDTVVQVTGGVRRPDGSVGINVQTLGHYKNALVEYDLWQESAPVRVAGIDRRMLEGGITAIVGKIEQYFALCAWEAFYGEAPRPSVGAESAGETSGIMGWVETMPLAAPTPECTLELSACNNGYYIEDLNRLFKGVLSPLAERELVAVDTAAWTALRPELGRIESWYGKRPPMADKIEEVIAEHGREYLSGNGCMPHVENLVAAGAEAALDLDNVRHIEKLILYQLYLMDLVNNFVSFPSLYSPTERAAFERGYLVMDGRRFNLAVTVPDRPTHIQLAKNSSMFVLYVAVLDRPGSTAYEVAIPVTSGRKGNLAVGKRGLFVDRKGNEYGAVIKEVIDNPISIAQAIVAPFKRIGNMITGKIEAITQESQSQLDSFASGNVEAFPAAQATQNTSSAFGGSGLLLGGSVAFAAIGSAAAYITNTLTQLKWWQFLAGLGGIVALVILPATALAFIKLRQRDLSAIIEASGWAVNARMRLTHRLGREFTFRPRYPKASRGVPLHRRE